VRTGTPGGDWVEVTAGLRPGERVVTRGVFNVKAGDPLAIGQVTGE
jgi:multidrug efflux pump subunit AcrA (membrane-fusion protein)